MWDFCKTLIIDNWHSLLWRDALELIAFSSFFYCASRWLSLDKRNNLMVYLYVYVGLLGATHLLQLNAVYILLLISAPIVAICFIVLHQEQLQRNFISLKKIKPLKAKRDDAWIEQLMRGFLYAMNAQKDVICILEQSDALPLAMPFEMQALLSAEVVQLMVDAASYQSNKMVWVTMEGKVVGYNATCTWSQHEDWKSDELKEMRPITQDALLITQKTDALAIMVNAQSRSFSIAAQGKLLEHMNVQSTLNIVKTYCDVRNKDAKKDWYARLDKKGFMEQRQS